MNRLVIKSTLTAAAFAVSFGTVVSAKAGQVDETFIEAPAVRTATVSYNQSDLASSDARAALEQRIRSTAKDVCGSDELHGINNLRQYAEAEQCVDAAVAQAMSQVGVDQVASTAK